MPNYEIVQSRCQDVRVHVWARDVLEALRKVHAGEGVASTQVGESVENDYFWNDPELVMADFSAEEVAAAAKEDLHLSIVSVKVASQESEVPPPNRLVCPRCFGLGPFELFEEAQLRHRPVGYSPDGAGLIYVETGGKLEGVDEPRLSLRCLRCYSVFETKADYVVCDGDVHPPENGKIRSES